MDIVSADPNDVYFLAALELAKFLIPAGILLLIANNYLQAHLRVAVLGSRERPFSSEAAGFPLKMQAYERLVLLLERISPENLLPRVIDPTLPAPQLHHLLVSSVRAEWEHNVSQQIYIDEDLWTQAEHTKNLIISLIDGAGTKAGMGGAIELVSAIAQATANVENTPWVVVRQQAARQARVLAYGQASTNTY